MPIQALSFRVTEGDFSHGNRANGPQDDYYAECVADRRDPVSAPRASAAAAPRRVDPRVARFALFARSVDYGKFIGYQPLVRGNSTDSYTARVGLIVDTLSGLFEKYTVPVLGLIGDRDLGATPAGRELAKLLRAHPEVNKHLDRDPLALVVLLLEHSIKPLSSRMLAREEAIVRADANRVRATRPAAYVEAIRSGIIPLIESLDCWYLRDRDQGQLRSPTLDASGYFLLADLEPKLVAGNRAALAG